MIPNITDEPFTKFPLLWSTVDGVEEVDLLELCNGAPTRWVSCVTGDLVVVDVFDEEHVIYADEWEARPMQRLAIKRILAVTTDTDKFDPAVTNTATYVRVYW